MKLNFDFDASVLQERFKLSEKNIAYAAVNSLNKTAKQVQELARANVREKFHVRTDFIVKQAAIIKQFASVTKGVPSVEIAVGQKPRLLLPDFEKGADRPPFVGSRVAMPVPGSAARPTPDAAVPDGLWFKALGLHAELTGAQKKQRRSIKGGNKTETRAMRKEFTKAATTGKVWKGNNRTYMIPGVGVFQRTGKGRSNSQLIYKFVPTQTLVPKLGFLAMAKADGDKLLMRNLDDAIKAEMIRNRK